jgi:hypothetical protein
VISVQELSFQQQVKQSHTYTSSSLHSYLRLDIPKLVRNRKHGLFDLPGICDRHVTRAVYGSCSCPLCESDPQLTRRWLSLLEKIVAPKDGGPLVLVMYGQDFVNSIDALDPGVMLRCLTLPSQEATGCDRLFG